MPTAYDVKLTEKLRIEAALRGVYSAGKEDGVVKFLENPDPNILALKQISFIARAGHRQLLQEALLENGFEFWVEGAAAVIAVCVPSYKNQSVSSLFDQTDAAGYLIPQDPEANEIYWT